VKPRTHSPATHTGPLLAVLDEEIRLLELRRSQLEALSVAIVERDDERMESLLGEIQQAVDSQADADLRLKAVRRALADDMGFPIEQVRLELLIERLRGGERTEIERRRRRIIDRAERLRRQHLHTSILLLECTRINRLLLEALFPQSKGLDTYVNGGPDRWCPDTGTVSAEG
jgi:hypothetical protein